jgi:hypothetical protein
MGALFQVLSAPRFGLGVGTQFEGPADWLDRSSDSANGEVEETQFITAVQNRQKSSGPCWKRGLCVPESGILKSRPAASR